MTAWKAQRPNHRGVALIVVLWVFIFLFVVAFNFTASVRENAQAAHRYRGEAEGYYLALAGFHQGLHDLLHYRSGAGGLSDPSGENPFEQGCREETLGHALRGHYRVCWVDEGGKVNLNRTNDEVLRRIFAHLEVEEPRLSVLVDSILDWRDEDNFHRASGAENDYYRSLSLPYTARNGPFMSVEELLWVRGMTPELFYGRGDNPRLRLGEIFTVDSPTDRVNLRTMSAAVCRALLGIARETCERFAGERRILSEKTLVDLVRILGFPANDPVIRQFVFVDPSVVSIEAAGRVNEGDAWRRVKGVVRMASGNRDFDLIRWIDRDPGPQAAGDR